MLSVGLTRKTAIQNYQIVIHIARLKYFKTSSKRLNIAMKEF